VCSLVQTAADVGVVCSQPGEAHTTTDEPPGDEVRNVADQTTYITALGLKPNEARTATDKPPRSGRDDVANHAADGDWQELNRRRVCLHGVVEVLDPALGGCVHRHDGVQLRLLEVVGNERVERRVAVFLELALDQVGAAAAGGGDVAYTDHAVHPLAHDQPVAGGGAVAAKFDALLLPEGGSADPLAGTGLVRVLGATIEYAKHAGRVRLDPEARELWYHAYTTQLASTPPGIAGALLARAEAHVIRLALLQLADGERQINPEHLQAALALWDYAARSASWALQGATGDPLAEQIHAALKHHPGGLTRSQISDLLQHNRPAEQIQQALNALAHAGRATRAQIPTAGRPAELWTAAPAPVA
jgi:hypothetical protein